MGRALKPGVPWPRGQFLPDTFIQCEVLELFTGLFVGWFVVPPFNDMFSSLSVDILKFGSCSQTVGPVAMRSVLTSYVCPMGGLGTPHGAVWVGASWFHPLTARFQA